MTWKYAEIEPLQEIRTRQFKGRPSFGKRGAQSIFKLIRLLGETLISEQRTNTRNFMQQRDDVRPLRCRILKFFGWSQHSISQRQQGCADLR